MRLKYSHLIAQNHKALAARLVALDDSRVEKLLRRIIGVLPQNLFLHATTAAYMSGLKAGEPFESSYAKALVSASEELDEQYFRLQEDGASEDVWAPFFHQARMAVALALMAEKPTRSSICNIVYEMAHAQDDLASFLDRVAEEVEHL